MNSSSKDPRVYLQDILDAIARIEHYSGGDRIIFLSDEKTQDAIIRQLSIVGEASRRISAEMRKEFSEIPWRKIVALRNIIVHEYSAIHMERIWTVIEKELPNLKDAIEIMLRTMRL